MDKQTRLQRLDKVLAMIDGLKEEEFAYNRFISKGDAIQRCGTVCCIAGWLPKHIPEAGLIWMPTDKPWGVYLESADRDIYTISDVLHLWHGLPGGLIALLYYGSPWTPIPYYQDIVQMGVDYPDLSFGDDTIGLTNGQGSKLPEVRQAFAFVRELVENDLI